MVARSVRIFELFQRRGSRLKSQLQLQSDRRDAFVAAGLQVAGFKRFPFRYRWQSEVFAVGSSADLCPPSQLSQDQVFTFAFLVVIASIRLIVLFKALRLDQGHRIFRDQQSARVPCLRFRPWHNIYPANRPAADCGGVKRQTLCNNCNSLWLGSRYDS